MDISPKFRLFSYEQEVVIPETFAETPSQLVGGWLASSQQLSAGKVTIQANEERILLGSATEPLTGIGIFIGKDGSDYEFRAGDPSGDYVHWDGSYVGSDPVKDLRFLICRPEINPILYPPVELKSWYAMNVIPFNTYRNPIR